MASNGQKYFIYFGLVLPGAFGMVRGVRRSDHVRGIDRKTGRPRDIDDPAQSSILVEHRMNLAAVVEAARVPGL